MLYNFIGEYMHFILWVVLIIILVILAIIVAIIIEPINMRRTWRDQLNLWKAGHMLVYPKYFYQRFFYETTVCTADSSECPYKAHFIKSRELDNLGDSHDTTNFAKYIEKSDNPFATAFDNMSGDTRLVIPIPVEGKSFVTIKEFIDSASFEQQSAFWKLVAEEIERRLETREKVYVSTHGLGVPYFHLRICDTPKYYVTKTV
jgi:hypothetical protein